MQIILKINFELHYFSPQEICLVFIRSLFLFRQEIKKELKYRHFDNRTNLETNILKSIIFQTKTKKKQIYIT